jgi:hypothetical protein
MSQHAAGPRDSAASTATTYAFVPELPDLISAHEYGDHPGGGLVRLRISVTGSGVRVEADAMRPAVLERLLEDLGASRIDQMLCG